MMVSDTSFRPDQPLPTTGATLGATPPPQKLTLTAWLILIMASIGFAFDIYELLMLPLVLPPALAELLPGVRPGSHEFNVWRALMFWVPAMAGGVFGMLGGYLTDYLGRRRVLTWSILLYAVSAFLAGYSTSMTMLLVLRSTTFVGVCVEFVAAVAWLAELFPNPEQREKALGYTQAFSSLGGLMVSGAFLLISSWAPSLPAIVLPAALEPVLGSINNPHAAWRYTLMSGLVPAIPLILIRPFLPESPIWQKKKESGTLKRPSFAELFSPALGRTTIITTIMVACSYGAAFGAIQQVPQIVPGLPQVKEAARPRIEAALEKAKPELDKLSGKERAAREAAIRRQAAQPIYGKNAGQISFGQEIGGLIGRFVLAYLAVIIVSRQKLIRLFQIPGLILIPLAFAYAAVDNLTLFTVAGTTITLIHVGLFLAGLLTVAQFSFWGNYLPRVYPTHLRGTGESFAHNVGGRMIGTSFAAVTSLVSGLAFIPGNDDPTRVAFTAGGVALLVYLVGLGCSFLLPEPREEVFAE
jgi:MFS family permease